MTMRPPHAARSRRGFTLVEMLIVLLIIVLLTTLAAPAFSQMVKRTRVDQATTSILSACNRARAEAQRVRTLVALYIGDDTSRLATKPLAGQLPPYGQMEVWTVKLGYNDGISWISCRPDAPEYGYWWSPNWYPCRKHGSDQNLTGTPLTFSSGVRAVSCVIKKSGNDVHLGFPKYKNDGAWEGPIGEIKRHTVAYDKRGGAAGWDYNWNYPYILVFDTTTGEHRVIQVGVTQAASRARVMPWTLTGVRKPSVGTPGPLNLRNLPGEIDNYPTAENWTF
ncbi:MAG: prepilin-type N-terminal cleavage/methylation domain-containing protein [Planctomycetota bacterium]|nr:prepilin-type N-terminal cleavage/methylation domain-containing protein [Planctomycetota bacterium]